MGGNLNLKPPAYPALIDDLAMAKGSDRTLFVYGTPSAKVLEGRSISTIVDRLFPMLDGTRSFDEICTGVRGLAPGSVADALFFLFAEGLLIEGGGKPVRRAPGEIAFFDRYCAIKGNLAHGEACARRLAATRALVGRGDDSDAIVSILQAAGLGDSVLLDTTYADFAPARAGERSDGDGAAPICFLSPSDIADRDAATLSRQLRRADVPVLLLDPVRLEIGPLVNAGESGCLYCALAQAASHPSVEHCPMTVEVAYAMMSARIAMLVSDIIDVGMHETVMRLDLDSQRWASRPSYRLPGCTVCAPDVAIAQDAAETAPGARSRERLIEFFHLNTQDKASSASRSSHLLSYSPHVIKAVKGAYKSYPLTRQAMPAATVAQAGPGEAAATRFLQMLVALACWSRAIGDGVNSMSVKVTPSAGNLASQSLYLIAAGMPAVPEGVHYLHPEGSLVRIGGSEGRDEIARALRMAISRDGNACDGDARDGAVRGIEACASDPWPADALYIVVTSNLARLESKYQRKAYRFAMQDAGVLAHGVVSAARSVGLSARTTANFIDDRVAGALRICSAVEIVACVIVVELHSNEEDSKG